MGRVRGSAAVSRVSHGDGARHDGGARRALPGGVARSCPSGWRASMASRRRCSRPRRRSAAPSRSRPSVRKRQVGRRSPRRSGCSRGAGAHPGVRRGGWDAGYDFTHGALRDLAEEATSLARRRLLHRRIAEAIRLDAAGAARDDPARLARIARHERVAGRDGEAAAAFADAGEAAARVYANREAIDADEAALALGHPAPAELHARIGDVRTRIGDYAAATRAYEAAASIADPALLPRIEAALARTHLRAGDLAAAEAHLDAALAGSSEPAWQAACLADRAVIRRRAGDRAGAAQAAPRRRSLPRPPATQRRSVPRAGWRASSHSIPGTRGPRSRISRPPSRRLPMTAIPPQRSLHSPALPCHPRRWATSTARSSAGAGGRRVPPDRRPASRSGRREPPRGHAPRRRPRRRIVRAPPSRGRGLRRIRRGPRRPRSRRVDALGFLIRTERQAPAATSRHPRAGPLRRLWPARRR